MSETIKPEVGDIVFHKKGGYYIILMYGVHTEENEVMVIYKDLASGSVWVRPHSMFTTDRFKVVITAKSSVRISRNNNTPYSRKIK